MLNVWINDLNVTGSSPARSDTGLNFFLGYIYLRVVGWPYLKNSHAVGQCSRSSMHKVWNKDLNVAGSSPDRGDTEKNIFLGLVSPASELLAGFILRFPMRTVGRPAVTLLEATSI